MKSFVFVGTLIIIVAVVEVSSEEYNKGLAWLRGEYDYGNSPSEPEEEPLFDQGPQYVAPARHHMPQPPRYHAPAYPLPQAPAQQLPQFQVVQAPPPPPAPQYLQAQSPPALPQFQHQAHPPPAPPPPPPPPPPVIRPQYHHQPQAPPAPPPPPNPHQYHQPQVVHNPVAPPPPPAPQQQQGASQQSQHVSSHQGQNNRGNPSAQAHPQVHIRPHYPPVFPPKQELVFEENLIQQQEDNDKPNSWLFGGEPPAPTFSPEDERIRQQKFMQTKTKWDHEEVARQQEQNLRNREGEIVLNKAYVERDELALGQGKRIHNQAAVIPGGQHGPMNVLPPSPPPYGLVPHQQPQPQPDRDFVKPQKFYEGKIRPDEGTKFLSETYGIPRRESRRKHLHQGHSGKEEGQHKKEKGQSHALDDPPAEIMRETRWFDDDDDNESVTSASGNLTKLIKIIYAMLLAVALVFVVFNRT